MSLWRGRFGSDVTLEGGGSVLMSLWRGRFGSDVTLEGEVRF